MNKLLLTAATAALAAASPAFAVTTNQTFNAPALAAALAGSGINVITSTLISDTQNGFFSNGNAALGIGSGVVLTTGSLSCAGGNSNQSDNCGTNNGASSTLQIVFTTEGENLFFNYVFGSDEYNLFVGTEFNDNFSMTLTGPGYAGENLAMLPGGAGEVSINNVNLDVNSQYFRNNNPEATQAGTTAPSLNLPIELDGLTTVLTATATGLTVGAQYSLTFNINDVGDDDYDSAVFIQAGTISTTPTPAVPEPATWAMMIAGFGAVGASLRRRAAALKLA